MPLQIFSDSALDLRETMLAVTSSAHAANTNYRPTPHAVRPEFAYEHV